MDREAAAPAGVRKEREAHDGAERGLSVRTRLILMAAAALIAVLASAALGRTQIPWGEVVGREPSRIFWPLRVPRAALAAAAGASLGLAGVLCQTLFRNPLATPDTLGISTTASMAAATGILVGVRAESAALRPGTWLLAACGALAATGAILLLARLRSGRDLTHLLLAGVCLAAVSSAGIVLATLLADAFVTSEIVRWLMGSLVVVGMGASASIAGVFVLALGAALWLRRELESLLLGDMVAASRGVSVGRVVLAVLGLIGVLTATVVAHCGPIAFVSLIVPHLARGVLGPKLPPLLIGAPLMGAGLLALCDGVSRSLAVYEIPVGVVTSLLGAAFFFYLLITQADER